MITLETLAKKAGCSGNTVSLVLRDKGRISDQTRKKIKQLASNLGYTPNFAARSLATGRTGFVGIFIPALYYDSVRVELIKQLLEELHNHQLKPILGLEESDTGIWHNSSWLRTFLEINADAIILYTNLTELPPFLHKTPVILLGKQPDATITPQWDGVSLDRIEAGAMAARHIIEKGHKKVLAIGAAGPFLKGAEETLNSHADIVFECCSILIGGHLEPNPQAIFDYVRQSALGPTAVIVDDALVAARLAKVCMNQGLSLPADLSIIAYDYLPNVETYQVPLTLVEQPISEIIAATKELLMRRLRQPTSEYRQIAVHHKLFERQSTAG